MHIYQSGNSYPASYTTPHTTSVSTTIRETSTLHFLYFSCKGSKRVRSLALLVTKCSRQWPHVELLITQHVVHRRVNQRLPQFPLLKVYLSPVTSSSSLCAICSQQVGCHGFYPWLTTVCTWWGPNPFHGDWPQVWFRQDSARDVSHILLSWLLSHWPCLLVLLPHPPFQSSCT